MIIEPSRCSLHVRNEAQTLVPMDSASERGVIGSRFLEMRWMSRLAGHQDVPAIYSSAVPVGLPSPTRPCTSSVQYEVQYYYCNDPRTRDERAQVQYTVMIGNQRPQCDALAAVIKPSANFSAFDVAVQ